MTTVEELMAAARLQTPGSYWREGNEGLTVNKPIKSQTWIKLVGFITRAEAERAAKSIGWIAKDVCKLYGRFEYKWCVCGPYGQTLLKPEFWNEVA